MWQEHGWSEELSFMAAPAVGVGSAVRLLAIADMGQAEVDGSNENGFGEQHPSLATVRGLLRHSEGRRLVIHNGDISYARCALCPAPACPSLSPGVATLSPPRALYLKERGADGGGRKAGLGHATHVYQYVLLPSCCLERSFRYASMASTGRRYHTCKTCYPHGRRSKIDA